MTKDKIRTVIGCYRTKLETMGLSKERYPINKILIDQKPGLAHCLYMIDEIEELLDQDRLEKAFRWYGFLQACLWSFGVYTVEDLKNHSRPDIDILPS